MIKTSKYRIHLWSEIKGDFAPSLHPLQDSPQLARVYGRKHLKLEENLSGKSAFEVRPETV